ncbi:uncharacterized protein C6orf118 homolog [Sorex fumeus]|uniref:uncharacterized protein C6orf118 homolog n=1 Tax=Sorex fumeus TaxID=62283 RepID=UPI0024ADEEDC|nr:uncharacterized protein C6orf118 homolog [Sorex fumeus]
MAPGGRELAHSHVCPPHWWSQPALGSEPGGCQVLVSVSTPSSARLSLPLRKEEVPLPATAPESSPGLLWRRVTGISSQACPGPNTGSRPQAEIPWPGRAVPLTCGIPAQALLSVRSEVSGEISASQSRGGHWPICEPSGPREVDEVPLRSPGLVSSASLSALSTCPGLCRSGEAAPSHTLSSRAVGGRHALVFSPCRVAVAGAIPAAPLAGRAFDPGESVVVVSSLSGGQRYQRAEISPEGHMETIYLRWRHCETPGVETLCNLRKLLNRLQRAHREHVLLYTSGHLNHHNLYQPPRQEGFRWANSRLPPLARGAEGRPPPEKVAQMADALVHFTLHTALTPDDAEGSRLFRFLNLAPPDVPHPSEEDLLLECRPGALSPERPRKEELRWPELKVLKTKYWRSSRKCGQSPGPDRYQYVSTYLAGITKEDQYREFLRFQRDVLAKQDLLSSDFTGSQAALALERKLERELQKVCTCDALDFNRMHVCGQLFQDICDSSLIFGDLLKEIKDEYELYMAILLHTQPSAQYQALRAHVRAMEQRTLKTEEVSQAKEELKALVKVVKAALEHNDKVREELELEQLRPQAHEAKPDFSKTDPVDDECLTHIQKVEAKRCEILNKWDEIKAIENEIKTNMIHIGALNISENKYKSIEAETQKLEIEIRILKKNITIIEKQLKHRIERTKMNEKKQRRLWMFINDFVSLDSNCNDTDLTGKTTSETNLASLS